MRRCAPDLCGHRVEAPGLTTPLISVRSVTLAAGEDATCTFANFFDYRPEIELEKTPSRTVVLDGGSVTYTYVLPRNVGTVDLVGVGAVNDVVVDDQCDAVTRVLGSGSTLPLPETWTFECTVSPMAVGKATNLATATLRDPKTDETVQAKDERTVEVRVPDLEVVKTVDQPVVYPGTDVTYNYVATNIGETTFPRAHWTSRTGSPKTSAHPSPTCPAMPQWSPTSWTWVRRGPTAAPRP